MIKVAQNEDKEVICMPSLKLCFLVDKKTGKKEKLQMDDPRIPAKIKRQPGRRTFEGQLNKIAKLNTHTRLLSAKLESIKIGKLLEAKKKQ